MSEKSITETKRNPGRPKGLPKTGGRKPGSPNKSTHSASVRFQQACHDNNFDFGKELIDSLKCRDLDYSKVLISIMDYYFGKVPQQKTEEDIEQDDTNQTVNLTAIFKG
jgi:hypothetical protein